MMNHPMFFMGFIILGLGILIIVYLHGIERELKDISRSAEEIKSAVNQLIQDIVKKGINFFK